MKKILSILIAAIMIISCTAISTFAATDIEFSAKGATGKPDETVTFEVYIDKNVGTWSAVADIYYDNNALLLLSVENGEVFNDNETASSPLNKEENGEGYFRFYAESNSTETRNTNTGLFFKLTFQILKTAVNGDHKVRVEFPDDGEGWFFYPEGDDFVDLSVSCTKQAAITVVGSSATGGAETNEDKVVPNTEDGETTKTPVTAYVTDDEGKLIKDDNGNYETYVVTDKNANIPQYETDTDGEPVTDDSGNYETYYDSTAATQTTEDTTAPADKPKDTPAHRLILIAAILAVILAAVIIIIVVANRKKDNGDGGDTPFEPDMPETSDTPEAPEESEAPEVPEAPETPEAPEAPETPEASEAPETPEDDSDKDDE